ncbi:lipid A 1-phosphatase LpxE [Sediminibacterium sp. KACHI17]|uniref:Lipid A 1-phosphatase LpxE n=1 Tax=Sediminibacterium sp. KACHI17 TaxID=1751071 RepID=A0AAT9GEY0_9BACT
MTQLTKRAILISLVLGIVLFVLSYQLGKENAFLLLNNDLGTIADHFFRYWTHTADGAVWVPITLLIIFFKRDQFLLVLSSIVFSTLFSQLSKNIFFKGSPRPSLAISDHSLFHSVNGVELHSLNSFPSGHTTTAFTIFLLATVLIPRKWILPVGLCYAILAGYSRIYLAQHFPIDVAGGIIAAILTICISIFVQNKWAKN